MQRFWVAPLLVSLVSLACDVPESDTTEATRHSIEPVVTRAGHIRYVGEAVEDPSAYPVLVERIDDPSSSAEDRAALVEALPRTGAPFGAFAVARLEREPDPSVRAALVGILHRANDSAAVQGLRLGLGDHSPSVRAAAATTAGSLAEPGPIAAMLRAALLDLDAPVRAAAARSLGVLRIAPAFDEVASLLADPDPDVRLQAVHASERIDAQRAAALPRLADLRNDANARVARAAARLEATRR